MNYCPSCDTVHKAQNRTEGGIDCVAVTGGQTVTGPRLMTEPGFDILPLSCASVLAN